MAPATHRALTVIASGHAEVKDKPVPVLEDDSILVKVRAVSLNPIDWKHVHIILDPGDSVGMDFAGDVVEIGPKAVGKGIEVGDAVAGYIRGGIIDKDNGVYQEYLRTYPELVWKKPASLSYEAAAPMGGVALSTAAQALYYRLNIPKPWESPSEQPTILIWAGSTAVGIYAIQLAKASGLRVVTTASPKNFNLLHSLGADAVFDYKDPETPAKIKEWSGGRIQHAFDTISDYGSTYAVVRSFGSAGGRVVTLRPVITGEGETWPDNVTVGAIYVFSALKRPGMDRERVVLNWAKKPMPAPELKPGQKFFPFPKEFSEQDYYDMVEWNKYIPSLIDAGKLGEGSMPLKKWPGGLDAVADALEVVRQGKISAEKVVLTW